MSSLKETLKKTTAAALVVAATSGVAKAGDGHGHEKNKSPEASETPTQHIDAASTPWNDIKALLNEGEPKLSPEAEQMFYDKRMRAPTGQAAVVEYRMEHEGPNAVSGLMINVADKAAWNIENIANVQFKEGPLTENPRANVIQNTLAVQREDNPDIDIPGGSVLAGYADPRASFHRDKEDNYVREAPLGSDVRLTGRMESGTSLETKNMTQRLMQVVTAGMIDIDIKYGEAQAQLLRTTTHEKLHSVGLGHPHYPNDPKGVDISSKDQTDHTIMSYNENYDLPEVITPSPLDHQLLKEQFGENTKTNAGDTTYRLDMESRSDFSRVLEERDSSVVHRGYTQTIGDAGGKDVLDVTAHRGSDRESHVDLREGGNNPTKLTKGEFVETAVLIADGANIEDAKIVNGSIQGNDLDNRLEAEERAELAGGKGADTFVLKDGGVVKDFSIEDGDQLQLPKGAESVTIEEGSPSLLTRAKNLVMSKENIPSAVMKFKDAQGEEVASSVELKGMTADQAGAITIVTGGGEKVKASQLQDGSTGQVGQQAEAPATSSPSVEKGEFDVKGLAAKMMALAKDGKDIDALSANAVGQMKAAGLDTAPLLNAAARARDVLKTSREAQGAAQQSVQEGGQQEAVTQAPQSNKAEAKAQMEIKKNKRLISHLATGNVSQGNVVSKEKFGNLNPNPAAGQDKGKGAVGRA